MKFLKLLILSLTIYISSFSMFSHFFDDSPTLTSSISDDIGLIEDELNNINNNFKYYLYLILDNFLENYESEELNGSLKELNERFYDISKQSLIYAAISKNSIPIVRLLKYLDMDIFLLKKESEELENLKDKDPRKIAYDILLEKPQNDFDKLEILTASFRHIVFNNYYNLLYKHRKLINMNIVNDLIDGVKEYKKSNSKKNEKVDKILKLLKSIKRNLIPKKQFWKKLFV